MAFDPSKFGAVEIKDDIFDPTKFGATAFDEKPTLSDSLWSKIGQAKGFGQKFDTILQAGAKATRGIPGAKLGSALGTEIGGALAGESLSQIASQIKPEEVIGDTLKAGALPASFAVNPVSALGKIGAGAGLGAISATGESMSKNESPLDVAKKAAFGALAGGAVSAAFVGFGKLLEKTGEKITQGVIKPSEKDLKAGFKIDTIKKYKLGGSLSSMYDKTDEKLSELSHKLSTKLAGSNQTVDLNAILQETSDSLSSNKMKGFGSNTSIQNAVEQLKNEIINVAPDGTLSIPDAQLVKQSAGRFGAWQFGATDPESTARQTVYNAFYTKIKEAIEKNSPEGVKEINKQLSELIPVSHALLKRIPVADRNRVLSLQDMITLTASVLDPRALGSFGLSMAQKSGTVGNALMNVGPKIQRVAPIVGATVGDISSNVNL